MARQIIVLIVLIIGLILGIYLVAQKTELFSRAVISNAPSEVKISNISDNSFTASWITQRPAIGFVSFGPGESLGSTAVDDRDNSGPQARTTHHVTVKNLEPATTYFFIINSGGEIYKNQGKFFTQTTAPTTADTPPLADPIFGQVIRSDNSSAEALIYLNLGQSTPLSSYSRADGNFLITLNNARTKDLSNYISVKDSDVINFVVTTTRGSTQKQVAASERKSAISIMLEDNKGGNKFFSFEDLNNDGVVNAVDFAIFVKNMLVK